MEATPSTSPLQQLNRSHGSFELVLAPVLLGLFGFWLDGRLGIRPWLTVLCSVMGLAGAVMVALLKYRTEMAAHAARAPWTATGAESA